MKLTKSYVDSAPLPERGQSFHRDDVLQGFALRVTARGAKSFVVEKRINGRVRRKTLARYGVLTVEQARKEAQKFFGKVASGEDPITAQRVSQARAVTLAEVLEAYLAARKGLKATTVHDYRRILKEGFKDWQRRPLATISKDDVARRHAKLGERSHARANNAMRVLRALFNFAAATYEDESGQSLFPENPVNRISQTRAWYRVERRQTVIKAHQLSGWMAAVNELRQRDSLGNAGIVADYLTVLLLTGLRRQEAMQLQWSQVDLNDATLEIRDTKNRETLRLPMSSELAALFNRRRAESSSLWVFPGTGSAGHLIEPRKQMRHVIHQSGVSFTPHDLRRTFITVAESLDISVYAIKRLVNHKIGNDVTGGYVVSDIERLRAPMQRITDRILAFASREACSG